MSQAKEGDARPQPGDELLSNIPDGAQDWEPQPPFDPSDADVVLADRDGQIDLMRQWFLARYCDPAEETPYESREGGYTWIWGGPYDLMEQLQDRFGSVVDDELIRELAGELYRERGPDWAPIRSVAEEFYDLFNLELENRDDPLFRLRNRLRQALSVLDLQGPEDIVAQLPPMAFGTTISALEAYLWETIAYWVKNDRDALKGIVSNMPDLKDQPIKLGQIFEEHDAIELRVMAYLQNLVWHRWEKVGQLFRFGLGVKLPSVRPFQDAIEKRHHIVHRSGHDKDGNPVEVSGQDARDLAQAVEAFAEQVYGLIVEKIANGKF